MMLFLMGLAVIPAFILGGCDSSSSDSDSNSALQVESVTASPSAVEVGDEAIVEAFVSDGTNPLPNRVVMFTVDTGGSCNPSIDTTDEDGYAATVFHGTDAGITTITAWLSDEIYATVNVMVASTGDDDDTTGTGPDTTTVSSDNVTIAANPRRLEADGSSTSEVVIIITDGDGNPAPESTMVRLAAGEKFLDNDGDGYFTGGGVDALVIDAISNGAWDPVGWIDTVAYVEGDTGTVVVTYTAGYDPIAVYVRATVDDDEIDGFAQITIQLNPNSEVGSIALSADSIHLAVVGTGGYENGMLYATVYDPFGNTAPAGTSVYFIITDGPGGGEDLGGTGTGGPYVDLTNSAGVAVCPISSGTISGTIRVRAYNEGATIMSEATQIMVHAGPPAEIIVGAEICNTQYWGWINKRVEITALLSDVYHNPCPDSTVVYFSCDEGTILAHERRTESEEGIAMSWWLSGYDDPTADGIVEIYASTNGGTLADTGYFINSWIPDTLWFVTDPASGLTLFPTHVNADGQTMRFFYVEVRDLNRNFVVDQTDIFLSSDYLEVASSVVQDGCHASRVKTYLTSVVLDYDYSLNGVADDGIGAIDVVRSNYGSIVETTVPCTLLTGPAYYSGCNLDIESSVGFSSAVPFTVTIEDRWGNPLGDHTIVATVSGGGSVSNGTQKTNLYGEASGFILNTPASGTTESVTIRAQDIDPRGNITLTHTVTLN